MRNDHTEMLRHVAVYDLLNQAERARVEMHLATCPACASELARYRRIDSDLARLPSPWPDRAARDHLRATVLQAPQGRRRSDLRLSVPRGVWVAGVVIALGALLLTALSLVAAGRLDPRLALQGRTPLLIAPAAPPGATAMALGSGTPAPLGKLASPPPAVDASSPVAWLRQNAVPFDSTQPGGSDADLTPLKQITGDARIVAIGDAAYGVHETLAMKQRMLEYLVDQMGFTTLAVEASAPQAELINVYVRTGQGDPEQLVKSLSGGYRQTQEMLYTIRWMRNYNISRAIGSRLNFAGFDVMGGDARIAEDSIAAFLRKADPGAEWRAYGDHQELYGYLLRMRNGSLSGASRYEYARAISGARALIQYDAEVAATSLDQRRELQAGFQSENVTRLMRRAGSHTKVVLWGHNETLALDSDANNLGARLRARFADDLVVIGTSFYEGSLNAMALDRRSGAAFAISSPPPDSYEEMFAQTGLPRFFLDLRRARHDAGGAWLAEPRPMRSVPGETFDCSSGDYVMPVSLAERFDAIIFLGNASPVTVLFQVPTAAQPAC